MNGSLISRLKFGLNPQFNVVCWFHEFSLNKNYLCTSIFFLKFFFYTESKEKINQSWWFVLFLETTTHYLSNNRLDAHDT